MNRQTEYQPRIYQCHYCGDISSEETIGVSPLSDKGDTENYCTSCNSRDISPIEEEVTL